MKRYAIYARLGVGVMLIVFWGLVDSPLSGVIYILTLLGLSALRYRFDLKLLSDILEAVICLCYAFFWLPALLGLWLPAIGILEKRWEELESQLFLKYYEDRSERLKLESARDYSAREIQNAARLAEITERSRIAQDIHDHVGHEISGASLALQTTIKLYEKGDPRTRELLEQTNQRLKSAAEHLRETVHNLKPAQTPGVDSLKNLCDSFSSCPVNFIVSGDLSEIAHWELLAANLKETLTNVSRHSTASSVTVRLDGNAKYVRMLVIDNGRTPLAKPPKMGLGLTGMKDRVRAAGGTLTINSSEGFQVICVLPKTELNIGGSHEAFDS